MQSQRQNSPLLASLNEPLENEEELVDQMLLALSKGQLPDETWDRLNDVAVRDDRVSELAFAFEIVMQGKRLKTVPNPLAAEFLRRAALFFSDVLGDELGATTYLEKALALFPQHAGAFEHLEALLTKSGEHKRLADLCLAAAPHREKSEQIDLLHRAAVLYDRAGGHDERSVEALQQALKLAPNDLEARKGLEARYLRQNRHRDVTKLLESVLATVPPPAEDDAAELRLRLLDLYANQLQEPERALPHAELVLEAQPTHEDARRVAAKLLVNKAHAGRAAAALARAALSSGEFAEMEKFLTIELEHTRGAKRFGVLKRLGVLRQEELGQPREAFSAFEAALALDPSDGELRGRYSELAIALGVPIDAARTLTRVASAAKDAPVRARIAAESGALLRVGGDLRRARATFVSILSMPAADSAAIVQAAGELVGIYGAEGDTRALMEVLDKLGELDPDPGQRRAANEQLAQLAVSRGDDARAVVAYRRLLDGESRARALAELEPLYERTQDHAELAFVLFEREKEASSQSDARQLAFRAAEILTTRTKDVARASAAWRGITERYGSSRAVYASWIPLLEAQREWAELAQVLAEDADLAPESERAAVLARLAHVYFARLNDEDKAFETFRRVLEFDAQEPTTRAALEKLLSSGKRGHVAASILEPLYRAERNTAGLLRVLDVRVEEASSLEARLSALNEASRVAEEAFPERALELAGRGLTEAAAGGVNLLSWLERTERLSQGQDAKRRSQLFARALGSLEVNSPGLLALARRTGEAHALAGDVARALAVYKQALAFEPSSEELMSRVDELLKEQGNAEERVALYRAALEQGTRDRERRRQLLHGIGSIERYELLDPSAAILAYKTALRDDIRDREAFAALADLYAETEQWPELCDVLEASLDAVSLEEARRLRAQLADVASQHGQAARAREQVRVLLADAGLSGVEFEVVERVATTLNDAELAVAVLERRLRESPDVREHVLLLDRLGMIALERQRDPARATSQFRTAADLARTLGELDEASRLYETILRIDPTDARAALELSEIVEARREFTKLPALLDVLLAKEAGPRPRVALLLRKSRVLAEHLGDDRGALDAACAAFAIAPESREVLAAFQHLAAKTGEIDLFCESMDAQLTESHEAVDPFWRADLMLAKARLLGHLSSRYDEAALAYRSVLRSPGLDETLRSSAVEELEALVLAVPDDLDDEGAAGRRTDLRWLWNFRVERAADEERVAILVAWAQAEEEHLGDPERALLLYRRITDLDPEQAEGLDGVARLSLRTGDVESAVRALLARRERTEGEARNQLDLAIATVLLDRTTRLSEALAAVAAVLENAPGDPRALALGARLLRAPAVHARAVETFERALDAAEDPEPRIAILSLLIESADAIGEASFALFRWYEKLVDLRTELGQLEPALSAVLQAARRLPTSAALWDRAESLARTLEQPDAVAALYESILAGPLEREDAVELGKRAVSFFEEWFDDTSRSASVLERILESDPNEPWAFDRLKLLLDAAERWEDLFRLFDRAIVASPNGKRLELLEEAAQVAKDFASDPGRAIDYLEQLRTLRPNVHRVEASLERLYERTGRFRDLIALLISQISSQSGSGAQDTRVRIAALLVEGLKDPVGALAIVEEILLREEETGPRTDLEALLERILGATAPGGEAGDGKPPKSASKRAQVRQRAAAVLKERYGRSGREADLVRVLEIELEAMKNSKERARRHEQIAMLHETLGDARDAMAHVVQLVLLEPEVKEHRERLEDLAGRVDDYASVVDVLVTVAEGADDDALRVELYLHAGEVCTDRLFDPGRAVELFARVLGTPNASDEAQLAACRLSEPLLEASLREAEHLDVLERLGSLEPEPEVRHRALARAARLATLLGETARAIWAWEACREVVPGDGEALDGLVALFERAERSWDLVAVLRDRSRLPARLPSLRRADYVRTARILGETLGATDEAIAAWEAEEAEFGESDESVQARLTLLRSSRQWEKLAGLLERASSRPAPAEEQARLLCELGDVCREYLDAGGKAIARYEAAIQRDARSEGARAGLRALLRRSEFRAEAVRVLLVAHVASDEWRAILELTEHRIATAKDGPARIAIFHEAAALSERRADDREAAFSLLRRAFLLDPALRPAETELFRLAEATRQWRSVADAQREAIEAKESIDADPPWLRGLRFRMGEILERRLEDPRAALAAYARVAADDPTDLVAAMAVIRTGGRTMRWDASARVLIEAARANHDLLEPLVTAYDEAAGAGGAWDAATFALTSVVADRLDMDPSLARELETQCARWHRDRRGDPDAAEAALLRALAYDRDNASLLAELAQLQRRAKGRPLIDSLLRLSQATGGDLDLLREAADIAVAHVGDRSLAKTILGKLLRLAQDRWLGVDGEVTVTSGTPADPVAYVRRAIEDLTRLHREEGDLGRVAELLLECANLPFTRADSRRMRHEAAAVLATEMGAVAEAIELYERLFEEDPNDREAVARLVAILEGAGRQRDLLGLARKRVQVTPSLTGRLGLRIGASRLEAELGDVAQAIATLSANLDEDPRHEATVKELTELYGRERRFAELEALLSSQAERAEGDVDVAAAAELFAQAADVALTRLANPTLAAQHYRRVIALEPRPEALDALARLATEGAEHAEAAEYLSQLRQVVRNSERTEIVLRMVTALERADELALVLERLEEELTRAPEDELLRLRLLTKYRERDDFPELARTLTTGAQYAPDKATRLSRLREAAELYCSRVGEPAHAIPLLEMASDLAPDDRSIRLALADALGLGGRIDEARAMLRALIDDFAGRRPKERAPVHYHLARLDLVLGDRARALVELDAATRIDPANPEILRTLAELSRDDGQLERAERSYRALLTVLRRQEEVPSVGGISRSEVLVELAHVAERQEQHDRARELFESALELAADNDVESRRLERALRDRGDYVGLVRTLTQRLARSRVAERDFDAVTELARALDEHLGKPEEALGAWLDALRLRPGSQLAHDAALRLAGKVGAIGRYISELSELARTTERPASLASELSQRLGRALETQQGDLQGAVAAYERALSFDASSAEALGALDRVYERLGDDAGQARTLAARIALGKESSDALYRLAQLRFKSKLTVDDACEALERALEREPMLDRAESILKHASEAHPRHEQVLALYERIGRQGYPRALVDALTKRWASGLGDSVSIREAVETARSLPDVDLAEFWLRRFLEREGQSAEDRLWALVELARIREEKGDLGEAVLLKKEASESASPEDGRALLFEIARLAAAPLGDLHLAAQTYEELRTRDPVDREVWEPLLEVYQRMGEYEKVVDLLAEVALLVDETSERSKLRLQRVQIGIDKLGFGDGAAADLKEILDEDPSQANAAILLGSILERNGREEELVQLLSAQLEAARDREDVESIVSLSKRLGALLETQDREKAKEVYRRMLEVRGDEREVLTALALLYEMDGEAELRADVLELLLAVETGTAAERLALELGALFRELDQGERARAAFERGFAAHPRSIKLRAQLEVTYREAGAWQKLAEMYELEARVQAKAEGRVAVLRLAAAIFRDELGEPAEAARVMRMARSECPHDPGILGELTDLLLASGDAEAAIEELGSAIDALEPGPSRAQLLGQRAALRAESDRDEEALEDWEEAHREGDPSVREPLVAHLSKLADLAMVHGDTKKWRRRRLRLAELSRDSGQTEEARQILTELLKADSRDRDAIRVLARMEEQLERWDAASATFRRLVALEEGEAVVDVALRLANACERAGRLADARGGLERARVAEPQNEALRGMLERIYTETLALKELAEMYLEDARAAMDVAGRFNHLIRAGSLLLQHGQDPGEAVAPLEEARTLRPGDLDCVALLADAYTAAGRYGDANEVLNAAVTAFKGRRSRELSTLYHRLARVAQGMGNRATELTSLTTALDMDPQNGHVASELAYLAMELGEWDVASRALRAVTMLKAAAPLPRALAYQHLGEIAQSQGDVRRAVGFLKRALDEDPSLEAARALLETLS